MSDDKHFDRLTDAVRWSYDEQRDSRKVHHDIIKHLMGEYYPVKGQENPETTINLLSLAYRAWGRFLIARNPRALAITQNPMHQSWAEDAQIAVNRRIERSNVARVLRDVVDQSLASLGTFFLGADYVGTRDGMELDLVMHSVDRADFVYDLNASTLEDADFEGHKFRLPIQDVREHPLFGPDKTKVMPTPPGAWQAEDRTNFNTNFATDRSQLYDYVDMWCAYERRRGMLFTYPCYQPELKLLEVPWNGPRHGPYRHLYYERPPNHAMPIGPLMHLLKKHRAFNRLDAKTIHQQDVAKGLLHYTTASESDAKTLVNSKDLQSTLVENGAVGWKHIGGTNPQTVAMAEKQKADFSYAAGNLEQVAGLDTQAETLGQERLLRGGANAALEDMGGTVFEFIKGVCEDIFWFDVRDPNPNAGPLYRQIEGTDLSYQLDWSPEKRRMIADLEFQIDVEPYSYRERSPEGRLADLLAAVQVIQSMKEEATSQGITLDVGYLVQQMAALRHLPELKEAFVMNQDPEDLLKFMGGGGQPIDASSPRRYERHSTSDGAGKDMSVMQNMKAPPSEEIGAQVA